jgi:exodeoxyribonuclease V gamma subunit
MMAFHTHTATRADAFIRPLADLFAAPAFDPLGPEVVGIPTRGLERWVSQQLAQVLGARAGHRDGICANIEFRFLGGLIAHATTVPGIDPEDDPWRPDRAVWPLLQVVDELRGAPWLQQLVGHVGLDGSDDPDGVRRGRRYGVLRHVADLFDRYAMHRPEMVVRWAAGGDDDGGGGVLDPEVVWQAKLWRALRERIGVACPAERLDDDCIRIREHPESVGLPPRLAIVGVSRLPASYLRVLVALSGGREVHLFALHPSPELWDRMRVAQCATGPLTARRQDRSIDLVHHPLLAAWGRDARELQIVLGEASAAPRVAAAVTAPPTLLGRIQADIRADRAPGGIPWGASIDGRPQLAGDDDTVQVHACHGRSRQVEVLRDALLHLFARDPSLEPRDVIVLCPDLPAFAPLVKATFATGDGSQIPLSLPAGSVDADVATLRVRVSDRSQRELNPLIGVLEDLVRLANRRVTATEVLEFAMSEPVRRRFRFDDDDLDRLEDWVRAAEIRWGLDRAARAEFGLGDVASNTWQAGIDRLLAGVAMADEDERTVAGLVPVDSVESGAIDLVGRFAEFVDRLGDVLRALQTSATPGAWSERMSWAVDALALAEPEAADDRVAVAGLLARIREDAGDTIVSLDLDEFRTLLRPHIAGEPARTAFRTGALTVTSMVPMRGVPHRVVCLLGLDDAVFPAKPTRDGDDLMLGTARCGDRDARSESLAHLLDALLAAGERLVITYAGRNELTNVELSPAVPVGELLDACAATVRIPGAADGAGRDALLGRVWIRHPLQAFDARNFLLGGLMDGRVWGFDRSALDGARVLAGPRPVSPGFLAAPLAPLAGDVIELEALVRFVEHPCREFLRTRLGVRMSAQREEIPDELPVRLEPLEAWRVGDRLLAACLAGADMARALEVERARGALPPGVFGQDALDEIATGVQAILDASAAQLAGPPRSVPIDLALAGGRRLVGVVPGFRDATLLGARYARLSVRLRAAAWVRLLALTLTDPSSAANATLIGKPAKVGAAAQTSTIGPIPPDAARTALEGVVRLYDDGMRQVPVLFAATSARYAEAARRGGDRWAAAAEAWDPGWQRPGEVADPEHRLVFGGAPALAVIRERFETRFTEAAAAFWNPLLDYEH